MTVVLTPASPVTYGGAFRSWCQEHGFDAVDTYRIELGDSDMVVYRYARDEEGHFFYDPDQDGAAVLEPLTVALVRRPPSESVPGHQ